MLKQIICASLLLIYLPIFAQVQTIETTCEHKKNPIGISVTSPRVSLKISSTERNVSKIAYQIRVITSPSFTANTLMWYSKKSNQ